jgi:hypothetical protein
LQRGVAIIGENRIGSFVAIVAASRIFMTVVSPEAAAVRRGAKQAPCNHRGKRSWLAVSDAVVSGRYLLGYLRHSAADIAAAASAASYRTG